MSAMKQKLHHADVPEPLRSAITASVHLPEFLRLPKNGQSCPVSGLGRATINTLILGRNPKVKSVCLRRSGATRGVRLVVTESLLGYLRSLTLAQGGGK
jgi:hypothetical protein